MAPRKQKPDKALLEEKPEITLRIPEEIEAKIRETAEELKKAEETEMRTQKTDDPTKGEKIKQNIERVKAREGIIGYILRNAKSASIDLKDPTKIIDYAILSSSVIEASEELAKTFELGDVKQVLVEGNTAKLLSFAVKENNVSVFMEKSVDHNRVYKDLVG